jgi:UDP-N-acetylmuramoyl-L-alanyl-D-glutamate--2,6-diaminopimelate ligase
VSKYLNDILSALNINYNLVSENAVEKNPLIKGISFNSKSVNKGDLFVCLVGENFDAHNFVNDAVANGASVVLAQKSLNNVSVPVVEVENTAIGMALISSIFYGNPSSKLRLLGVTGTNGKTTVTHLVEQIFEKAGNRCGLIGTLGHRYSSKDEYRDSKHTTPQSSDLQRYLQEMSDMNFEYVVMEVSSHALDLHRVLGCDFAVSLITNLTQDHLDFHITMDNYATAKLKLFTSMADSVQKNKTAIINLDDPSAKQFINAIPDGVKTLTYGISSMADITAADIQYKSDGTYFYCKTPSGNFDINLKLMGQFSVYNALSAISIALAENIPVSIIQETLHEVNNVSGRFEVVSTKPIVIVDYAHTPDGLVNVLNAARKIVPEGGKLITVFGCGGDRDPTKRPKMGKITEELSDKIIVTSDNPRTEDPQQIITDILTGIKSLNSDSVQVEINRALAIEIALRESRENDVVVVAGKGHENYQILADRTIHFDDREVVVEVLEK